jgi:HD-like signal output (HDOD) protein
MSNPESTHNSPQTLDQWTRALCDKEMPIFSNTAQNIYSTLDDKKKGAMELGSIILQDPNLTSKILKISNTVYYNPSNQKINTISRAIIILGSQVIREITIACSFFESIISSKNKQYANEEIAHAIHAAVQAKEIAILCNDTSPEEIFIATLLNNIGSITFWCFGDKHCQYLAELIDSGNFSPQEAEKKVLGFSLSELGKSLAKSWKLGGLIEDAISNPPSLNTRTQTIQQGKEIVHAINTGWKSKAMESCLKKLASSSGKSQKEMKLFLKKNTESAAKIAYQFGAHDASHFIQSDTDTPSKLSKPGSSEFIDKKQIQFQILQDITHHMEGSININLLFEMIVEGIHRGVGMDRTVFCLFNSGKSVLIEKLSLGWLKEHNTSTIKFEPSNMPANLFFKAINTMSGIWATPEADSALFSPHVINTIGRSECFLIPIQSENTPIGLFYCDRSFSNKPLTEEDFNMVKHFSQQASIGLMLYKVKKNS